MKRTLLFVLVMALVAMTAVPAVSLAEAQEPVTLSVMLFAQVNAELNSDMLVFQEVEKETGVRFDFTNVPGADYAQKLQVTLASDKLPDIIEGFGDMTQYIAAGKFAMLDDLLASDGQNILAVYDRMGVTNDLKFTDGHFYSVNNLSERIFSINNYINNEWLTATGKEMPTTVEELYDVLVAFKEAYPEGLPFTCGPWASGDLSIINTILLAYGITGDMYMYDAEVGFEFGPYSQQEKYKAALTWLSKAYAEGLIDPQMFSITDDQILVQITGNATGMFRTWGDSFSAVAKGGQFGTDFVALPVLGSEFGEGKEIRTNPISVGLYISADSEHAADAIRAFNYMYSEEGIELLNWGVEGVTYTVNDDGSYAYTDVVTGYEGGAIVGRYVQGMCPPHFANVMNKDAEYVLNHPLTAQWEVLMEGKTMPLQPALAPTLEESSDYSKIMADINKYVEEMQMNFITGRADLEGDFDKFISQLQKMKIEEAIAIKNAQYQRYLDK